MEREVTREASEEWAAELAQNFSSKQIVLLSGDLGAGKTQWVQWFLKSLGKASSVSPTYSVIHEISDEVFHIDLYRLESEMDVESVGFWDLFMAASGIIFVEWPERINEKDLPLDWSLLKIRIAGINGTESRRVQVSQRN